MSRRRIVVVAPDPSAIGGQAVQAAALAAGLRADGHEVAYVATDPARRVRVPVVRTLVNESLYLPRLARLAAADTVLVFSASYWSFVLAPLPALLAARAAGAHPVLVYHSGEADDHLRRWGKVLRPMLALARRIVVPSEFLKRIFARHGYGASVIPNVVDVEAFRFRERRPLRPRLLSARTLEPCYAVEDTLRAFASVRRRFPEATLTIAGDGSERRPLEALAAELAPGSVRFLGAVPQAEMPRVFDDADLFVNASVVDNQPVSFLEAFAAGLPVVSTAAGGIGFMVRSEETGLLVPPHDPDALAEAIERALGAPEFARACARRARREVVRHTWPEVRDLWRQVGARGGES